MSVLFSYNKYLISIAFKCMRSKYKFLRFNSNSPRRFVTFDEINAQRREEAQRSIVVGVTSQSSFRELCVYCAKYGSIKNIYHYNNLAQKPYMIIEFSNKADLEHILQMCSCHQIHHNILPVKSPFLWFREEDIAKYNMNTNNDVKYNESIDELLKCHTLSDQVQLLYNKTKLSDVCIRLRYMVARQMELILESVYSNIVVQPFGSSVNGFGKVGSDLDLVLTYDCTKHSSLKRRLVCHGKPFRNGNLLQKNLQLVAKILRNRAPGVSRVYPILGARVPIVKYSHTLTELECDLAFNNKSGVFMSELLWLFGALDQRVRPLVFVIRSWARSKGVTSSKNTTALKNFPLTLMVLFFLQQNIFENEPILPSFNYLMSRGGKEEKRISEHGVDCTFLRDLDKLPSSFGQSRVNLETLLMQFFEYYSRFDFRNHAICVWSGAAIVKPSNSPLFVVNPMCRSLNVSINVNAEACARLRLCIKHAAELLTTTESKTNRWGVLQLVDSKFVSDSETWNRYMDTRSVDDYIK